MIIVITASLKTHVVVCTHKFEIYLSILIILKSYNNVTNKALKPVCLVKA